MIKGFHKEGRASIAIVIILAMVLIALTQFLSLPLWANAILWLGALVLPVLILQFFRVPARHARINEKDIISPADGKVVVIEKTFEKEYLKQECIQISVFMSPLNVHINWFPIPGKVSYHRYHPGKFLVAFNPKSSELNERNSYAVKNEQGEVLFKQIAGAVARRICYYPKVGDTAQQGQQFGFIKFGSRVDVYVPLDAEINVKIGDKVKGSITTLARFK